MRARPHNPNPNPKKRHTVIRFCYDEKHTMRRHLPPLNALVVFEAAARHGNFTRAAEELAVAQPAVTRHIAKIEDWIGSTLFRRRGSRVELTQKGRDLAEISTSVFDRLELGVRDLARSAGQDLIVGSSFGVAHLWLMPRAGHL